MNRLAAYRKRRRISVGTRFLPHKLDDFGERSMMLTTGLSEIRGPISPVSNKVHSDLVPRCRDRGFFQTLNESSITLGLHQADDDNIELLSLTVVDGVYEAIEPLSSCGFLAKILQLCSVGG